MYDYRIFSAIVSVLLLFSAGQLSAQVNTEAMRKAELEPGLHTQINLDLSLIAGNSSLTTVSSSFRLDYLQPLSHSFLVGSLQHGSGSKERIINKGFIHLRRTRKIIGHLSGEGFIQQEFNEFIRLKNRNLVGGGVRVQWLRKQESENKTTVFGLYSGHGVMWEREQIDIPADPVSNFVRSTNYLLLGWQPDKRVLFQATTYFQPRVADFNDFRVLFDGSMIVTVTGKFSVAVKVFSRYDNDPPVGVKSYDIELTNGLIYAF